MKMLIKQSMIILLVVTCLAPFVMAADELIPPTRILTDSNDPNGYLSIFSEPPGLRVYLDGSNIGLTPLFAVTVKSGTHRLKVDDKETKVFIAAGESKHISLHKGAFIDSTPELKAAPEGFEQPRQMSTGKKADRPSQTRKGKKEPKDPLYWPLNPTGPIQ